MSPNKSVACLSCAVCSSSGWTTGTTSSSAWSWSPTARCWSSSTTLSCSTASASSGSPSTLWTASPTEASASRRRRYLSEWLNVQDKSQNKSSCKSFFGIKSTRIYITRIIRRAQCLALGPHSKKVVVFWETSLKSSSVQVCWVTAGLKYVRSICIFCIRATGWLESILEESHSICVCSTNPSDLQLSVFQTSSRWPLLQFDKKPAVLNVSCQILEIKVGKTKLNTRKVQSGICLSAWIRVLRWTWNPAFSCPFLWLCSMMKHTLFVATVKLSDSQFLPLLCFLQIWGGHKLPHAVFLTIFRRFPFMCDYVVI